MRRRRSSGWVVALVASLQGCAAREDAPPAAAPLHEFESGLFGSWIADDPSRKSAPTLMVVRRFNDTELLVEVLHHDHERAQFRAWAFEVDGERFFGFEPLAAPWPARPLAIGRCLLADGGRRLSLRFVDDRLPVDVADDPRRLVDYLRARLREPGFLDANEPSVSQSGVPYRWRRPQPDELDAGDSRVGRR